MIHGRSHLSGQPPGPSLLAAFIEFQTSDCFLEHPLGVRTAFQRIAAWLPVRDASYPLARINASFGKMLRDRAARERGWKFGNMTLVLVQILVARAVKTGTLADNRVKQIPKLPPVSGQQSSGRRYIKPVRHRIASIPVPLKTENTTG
jgi:hypothetical protein